MHQFAGLYLFAHLVRRWEQCTAKGEVIQTLHSDTSGVIQGIPVSVYGYTGQLTSGGAVPHRMNTSLQERALYLAFCRELVLRVEYLDKHRLSL